MSGIDLIELPEAPHNLAFGGDDSRDLYVTALTSVYRLRTDVPGINPQDEEHPMSRDSSRG